MLFSRFTVDEILMINCVLSFFGVMYIGLSFSINSYTSTYSEDVSASFLHLGLGLFLCLLSIGALIITRKGILSGKKLLLETLLVFLKIVQIMMAGLSFISLVVQCQYLANLLDSEMKVGMGCLLIFLHFMVFICWIPYFWIATSFIMAKLEIEDEDFRNQSTRPSSRDIYVRINY